MSKIIAFLGSPRKNAYSTKLVKEAIRGAQEKGAEVKIYDLNDDKVKGCQGCLFCRSNEGCATKDYLQPMYEDIRNADAIIFSSPVYMNQITGQSKQWLDRLFPLVDGEFQPRYPGKKVFTILSAGNVIPGQAEVVDQYLNTQFSKYGWKPLDSLYFDNTASPGFELSEELLKKAFAAGELLTE